MKSDISIKEKIKSSLFFKIINYICHFILNVLIFFCKLIKLVITKVFVFLWGIIQILVDIIKYIMNSDVKSYEVAGAKVLKKKEKQNIKIYLDKLFNAIKDKNVHNVALSGGYGTGKSSIIKTFLNDHLYKYKRKRYVVISVGSIWNYKTNFKTNENKLNIVNVMANGVGEKNEDVDLNIESKKYDCISSSNPNPSDSSSNEIIDIDELQAVDKIEESILKQLIHINNKESMPESNLHRIKSKYKTLFFISLILFLFVNFFVFLISENYNSYYIILEELCKTNRYCNYIYSLSDFWCFLYVFVLGLSVLIFVFLVLKNIFYKNIIKNIKTEKGSIEVKSIDDLTFNKKLFEILYIFKQNKIEAVFFEDIDRFSDDVVLMVMEELKELNTIINTSKVIKHDVTFIYEFKDDIFKKYEDRSKFYDYIISVMTLSTPSNSLYLLDGLLNGEQIDLDLIKIVSNHITDYRTMVNIVNDYKLFKEILNIEEEEKNYLFATMVYKNINIASYNAMCEGKNVLDDYINKINLNVNDYIEKMESLIYDIQFIYEKNEKIIENESDFFEFLINNLFVLSEEKKYIYLKKGGKLSIDSFKSRLLKGNFDISGYKCIGDNEDLYMAVNHVLNSVSSLKINDFYKNCVDELNEIKSRPKRIRQSLCELILSSEYETDNLVSELVISEYLNANYLDYISLPVENEMISKKDYRYLLRISHGLDASNIEIVHKKELIELIDYNLYSNLRNYYLFDYYFELSEDDKNNAFFVNLFEEFNDLTYDKIVFIVNYIDRSDKINAHEFICNLVHFYGFLDNYEKYYSNSKFIKHDFNKIMGKILEIKELMNVKFNYDFFVNLINQNSDILYQIELFDEDVVSNLFDLNIRFNNISILNDSLKKFIYDNRLYSFSIENIRSLGVNFDDEENDFIQYLLENIELFYKECYAVNPDFEIDSEILTNKIISSNVKNKIKKIIAIREGVAYHDDYKFNLKVPEEFLKLTPDWRCIKAFYEQDNSYSVKRLVKYVIENKSVLFNDNVLIRPIVGVDFIIKLFDIMLNCKMLNEISMYLNALKKDKKYKNKVCFNIKKNYDANVITFMINNRLVKYTFKNAQIILLHKEIKNIDKGYFFENVRSNRGYDNTFKLVQNDVEVLKLVFIYCSFDRKKEIIMHLKLSDKDLCNIYSSLLKDGNYFDFTKSEFNKIIKPNENMFEVIKVENIYRIKNK